MKHVTTFFFASTVFAIVSCSPGSKDKDPLSVYTTNAQMSAVRNLTTEERAIATRICYAYQSKATSFKTATYQGGTFNFSVNSVDCDDNKENYVVSSILSSGNGTLSFEPGNDVAFEKSVQTSQSGFLVKLCNKIQNNQPISNTATDDGTKVQVRFFKTSVDAYSLHSFSPDDDGGVKITHAETFQVRTQFNITDGQILGMDEKITKQETCAFNKKKFSEFNQQFSSFKK